MRESVDHPGSPTLGLPTSVSFLRCPSHPGGEAPRPLQTAATGFLPPASAAGGQGNTRTAHGFQPAMSQPPITAGDAENGSIYILPALSRHSFALLSVSRALFFHFKADLPRRCFRQSNESTNSPKYGLNLFVVILQQDLYPGQIPPQIG